MSDIKEILNSIYVIYEKSNPVHDFIKKIRIDQTISDNDKFNMIYNYNDNILINERKTDYVSQSTKDILLLLYQADKLINNDCNRLDLMNKIYEKINQDKSLDSSKILNIAKNFSKKSPKLSLLKKIFQQPPSIDNLVGDILLYLEKKDPSTTLKTHDINEEKLKIILNDIKALVVDYKLQPIEDILTKKHKLIVDQIKESIEKYTTNGSGFNLEDMKKDTTQCNGIISSHKQVANLQTIYPILDKIQNNKMSNQDIDELISYIDDFKPVTNQELSLYVPNTTNNTNNVLPNEIDLIVNKYHFLIADFKRIIDNKITTDQNFTR